MRQLRTPQEAAGWLHSCVSGVLHTDSRRVRSGDGFIAWPGATTDGRHFVRAALEQGASACLVEQAGVENFGFDDVAIASYASLKSGAGPLASVYYEQPSHHLDVIAVTGTNGKTSTAWWLAQALSALEPPNTIPCGVVGTLGIGRPPEVESTGMTTPDPVLLQQYFRLFLEDGLQACAIEASSIGIAERRLDGTRIKVAIFTNFTQDHLDYHGSMEAYWQAKLELFGWPGLLAAVVNLDDPKGTVLARTLTGSAVQLWTFSCKGAARLQASDVGYNALGLQFKVTENSESHLLQTHLIGQFNVSNLMGVIGAMRALNVPLADAVRACGALIPAPGRMECIAQPGQPLIAVDFAHTPDALEKALEALRPLAEERQGQLWCVFGCGGDRDPRKRPLMGAVAEAGADCLVLTSDNPRSESPDAVIREIQQGLRRRGDARAEPDRGAAIDYALFHASDRDVILIAGKGHEDYQEAMGVKRPFSDRAWALGALRRRSIVDGRVERLQS
jgi:UDP-N-acetylmuramoyl-L-alanyl-D-glutamate--2,6-diaminopimelate ligase